VTHDGRGDPDGQRGRVCQHYRLASVWHPKLAGPSRRLTAIERLALAPSLSPMIRARAWQRANRCERWLASTASHTSPSAAMPLRPKPNTSNRISHRHTTVTHFGPPDSATPHRDARMTPPLRKSPRRAPPREATSLTRHPATHFKVCEPCQHCPRHLLGLDGSQTSQTMASSSELTSGTPEAGWPSASGLQC
jgi:hypothetical protein